MAYSPTMILRTKTWLREHQQSVEPGRGRCRRRVGEQIAAVGVGSGEEVRPAPEIGGVLDAERHAGLAGDEELELAQAVPSHGGQRARNHEVVVKIEHARRTIDAVD